MRCNEDEYLQPMTTTPPTNHAAYANADHSDNRDEHDDHQDHLIMILILMLMWILFLILMFYWCWCSVFHASFIMYFFFTIAISWIIIFYITTFHALFFTIHYVCNIFFDNHSMIMIIVIIIFSSCFCLLWFFCVIILQIVSSSSSALMSPFSLGNIYRMKRKMVWLSPHTHINAEFAVTISRSNLLVHQTFRRQTKNTWCTKLALIIQQESSFGWPFFFLYFLKDTLYKITNLWIVPSACCDTNLFTQVSTSSPPFPPPFYC